MRIIKTLLKLSAVVLVAGIVTLAILVSYTKDCPAPGTPPAGVETFTAITYACYGSTDVLQVTQLAKPVPAADEVLVRVHSAGVNPLDWHYMRGSPYVMRLSSGLGAPSEHRLGVDFAGTVEAVGADVSGFTPGDAVFGGANGSFAEYIVVRESRAIAHKPANVSFAQAATVGIAGVTALQGLIDEGHLRSGQKVLVNGASGGVGTFAVQIAHAMGAEVTGVSSQSNHALLRELGASHVIDYKQDRYVDGDQRYDLVIDMIGNHSPLENSRVMTPTGRLIMIGGASGDWLGPFKAPLLGMVQSPLIEQESVLLMAQLKQDALVDLADMMRNGDVTPVVGQSFPLSEIADAIALSESGRARGKIAITVLTGE